MDLQDLEARLKQLDLLVSEFNPDIQLECVIVGGGALLIKEMISRSTLDIDVLYASKIIEQYFPIFDFNSRVNAHSYSFPYYYEDRLELVNINTKVIKYYTPSLEDLIVSKLYAFREKDIEDLKKIIEKNEYDPTLLEQLVEEASLSSLNERSYKEMVSLYKSMFKEEVIWKGNLSMAF